MDRELARIVDATAVQRLAIERRVTALVVADFQSFDGWYSPRLIEEITATVASRVAVGQVGTAQLTDAYLARVTTYVTGRATVGASVPAVMGKTLRAGVADHEEVYGRVAAEFRRQRSLGEPDGQALGTSMARARGMVSTDMGLAHQQQTRRFNKARQVTKYRRVVRPELSASGSCGLCVAASDRVYLSSELLPIHARCKCLTISVTANTDAGSQLNEDTLSDLYTAADSTEGADLKRTRVTVVEHGELGPQLRVAGQNFRSPSEVAAA